MTSHRKSYNRETITFLYTLVPYCSDPNLTHNANRTYSHFFKDMANVIFLHIAVVLKPYANYLSRSQSL